jgi:hypothetical protein
VQHPQREPIIVSGQNSIFGASGFAGTSSLQSGTAFFRVTRISHGINIDYNEEEAASLHTLYLDRQIDDNFSVTILCVGHAEYEQAVQWFEAYGAFVTSPTNSAISPMAVIVPSFNFAALGVPTVGLSHGDMVGELVYPVTIEFVGLDSLDFTQGSTYTQAAYHGQSQFFYPSGVQTGSDTSSTDSILYDLPAPTSTGKGGQSSTGIVQPIGTGTP